MSTIHIVCPECEAVNKVPSERITESPKCGSCKKPLFQGKVVELNPANFSKHISRNDIPVVVDFWADWCGPCKAMAPVFRKISEELEPKFRFAKLNTDQAQDISTKYGIRSIPTLILLQKGKEINRISGAMHESDLRSWLLGQI